MRGVTGRQVIQCARILHIKIADETSQKPQIPYWTARFPTPKAAATPIRARNPKRIIHAVGRWLINHLSLDETIRDTSSVLVQRSVLVKTGNTLVDLLNRVSRRLRTHFCAFIGAAQ